MFTVLKTIVRLAHSSDDWTWCLESNTFNEIDVSPLTVEILMGPGKVHLRLVECVDQNRNVE